MRIDRIYQPVMTLGPGTRIAVWTIGCTKRCPGCANPELWEDDELNPREISTEALASALVRLSAATGIHRITFTGGDPLEQPDELLRVLALIRPVFDDVLVYTGYTMHELRRALSAESLDELTRTCDVIIDGPYVEALNDGACALRGSTNQRINVSDAARLRKPELAQRYDEEELKPRRVQNAVFGGRAMSIGIHGAPGSSGQRSARR